MLDNSKANRLFEKIEIMLEQKDVESLWFPAIEETPSNEEIYNLNIINRMDYIINTFPVNKTIVYETREFFPLYIAYPKHEIQIYAKDIHQHNIRGYYLGVFHELTHATMFFLKRKLSYSKEECVASLGSLILLNHFNILTYRILRKEITYLYDYYYECHNSIFPLNVDIKQLAKDATSFVLAPNKDLRGLTQPKQREYSDYTSFFKTNWFIR